SGLTEKVSAGASLGMLALGLVSFLVGAGLMSWRLRKVIDRGQGRVIHSWSVLGVSRTTEHRLGDFHAIGIVHGTVSTQYGTFDRYKVFLLGQREHKCLAVYLTEFTKVCKAREKADEVGKFTGLEVVDMTLVPS